MYDPLHECYSVTSFALYKDCVGVMEAFGEGVSAAEGTAKNTVAPNGKYPDAGAHIVAIWLRASYEALKLRWDDNAENTDYDNYDQTC